MAARGGRRVKSLVEKAFSALSNRCSWSCRLTALGAPGLKAAQRFPHSRSFQWSCGATLTTARSNPQKAGDSSNASLEDVEYIPKKRAKNPMIKIGYAWLIGLPSGIIGFLLAKREVDKNRLKQLKIRQRMRKSNTGEYESDRYGTVSKIQ